VPAPGPPRGASVRWSTHAAIPGRRTRHGPTWAIVSRILDSSGWTHKSEVALPQVDDTPVHAQEVSAANNP
jgi:hypothetical protein